ncbi:MAG: hypothetical protein IT292_04985 [Deltaproteobacteria bacterium]|nr:hypothetical protein [Deltaproteobacteria bacterium]
MFLFKFVWFLISGVIKICLLVGIGALILNSSSGMMSKLEDKATQDKIIKVAEVAGSVGRQLASRAWEEVGKYEVVIVKNEQ